MADYPASLDVRSLTTWPGVLTPAHQRRRSDFSATLTSTLGALTRELNALAPHRGLSATDTATVHAALLGEWDA